MDGYEFYGVRGMSHDDVWVVGYAGAILHWDGNAWSSVWGGTKYTLYDVLAVGSDVWVIGDGGTILHNQR